MKKIKIFIADDHLLIREGYKALLLDEPDFEIIGEAPDGEIAYQLILQTNPDVAIIDINMPKLNGLNLVTKLSIAAPQIPCIILSMHKEEEYILKSIENGAKGYLVKGTNSEYFAKGIREVGKGNTYYGETSKNVLLKSYIEKIKLKPLHSLLINNLTKRESEITRLVCQNLSTKEIAAKLFLSTRTIENHRSNILHKLNLKSSLELMKYAEKNNLL